MENTMKDWFFYFKVPALSDLSHEAILKYIRLVIDDGVNEPGDDPTDNGYILLNYHWQKNMGDLTFNEENFPDINKTITAIR